MTPAALDTERSETSSTVQTKDRLVLLPSPLSYSSWILYVFKHQTDRICSREEGIKWADRSRKERVKK